MELAKRGHMCSVNVRVSEGPPSGKCLSVWFAEAASGAI